ncbi:MAG: hypothetical protein ABIJ18_05015 [archaeon]
MVETVRERLEKLKHSQWRAHTSLDKDVTGMHKQITPETVFMKKIDKAISNIEIIRKKVLADSNSYLSLFYELRKAEAEFLELLKELDDKELFLPDHYLTKIKQIKSKIRKS